MNKDKQKWLNKRARELRDNLPNSEQWFIDRLNSSGYTLKDFKLVSNLAFIGKIPDLISKDYRLIIEIDGNIHNKEEIKENDKKKDRMYQGHLYHVIRVKAYSEVFFQVALEKLISIRDNSKINKQCCSVKGCRVGKNIHPVNTGYGLRGLCTKCLNLYRKKLKLS